MMTIISYEVQPSNYGGWDTLCVTHGLARGRRAPPENSRLYRSLVSFHGLACYGGCPIDSLTRCCTLARTSGITRSCPRLRACKTTARINTHGFACALIPRSRLRRLGEAVAYTKSPPHPHLPGKWPPLTKGYVGKPSCNEGAL